MADKTQRTYDLATIQKLHQSISHHGIPNIQGIGTSHNPFFDIANNGTLFPPSQDPAISNKPITLSKGGKYLYAMFAQCAPSATEHQGTSACIPCQNARGGRYSSCRTVRDGQGNDLANGACMKCTSTNHASKCSFFEAEDVDVEDQSDGAEDQSHHSDGAGEQAEAPFELERYHHLSTVNKFDFVVQVTSPVLMVDLESQQQVSEMPAETTLRIGVRLPGTDSYQLESEDYFDFGFKAEGEDLRKSVRATPETETWAASLPGSYISPNDFHTMSLLRACKTVVCRTTGGDKIKFPAGGKLLHGKPKHLPGFAMLLTMEGDQRDFFPLPEALFIQHLAQGTFEYANTPVKRGVYGTVDFTDEEVLYALDITSGEDGVACGVECQRVSVGKGEALHFFIGGGAVPLVWGRNAAGEVFVSQQKK
ncbi:hypothetical protein PRZ48_007402 [Zasmidium cellare]|uniref:Uncharacterized protein n=1 Tax=Zasmidium cellare TaxID=395010 RepID=A0ABR0ELD1_ZASCE|nr:hypothetical protein PRZ48_007402 [Zasmidium cellare]